MRKPIAAEPRTASGRTASGRTASGRTALGQPQLDGDQLEALFAQATSLAGEERSDFLERIAHANPPLGEELRSLVDADEQAQDFLLPPSPPTTLLPDSEEIRDIGPYRLLSKIGEGGNSKVYLGMRIDAQFRRRVAVKIMGLAAGAEQVRRFHAEQQILAGLEHPNIAHLYDGGSTDQGLPFFVMEYVEGEAIDLYCDHQRLSLEERIDLVREVCRGVQHAHQNLVVHRDLKPSNILVTPNGVPKLLDFGIAKSLNPEITNLGSPPTAPWDRMLTPQYASPEQICGLPTTTASDVYSLGVVLFELLTGLLPHRFHGMTASEMERTLAEAEPLAPSQAVRLELASHPDKQRSHAQARRLGAEGLAKRLDGDLDKIVLKSLRHDPQHRYGTVVQLADDLERYRQGKPVEARSPSLGYLARRFLSRHRRAVAVGALAVLLLLASAIGFATLAWKLRRERDRVAEERDRAQLYANLLEGVFEVSAPEQARGAQLTAREILDRAAERIRWLPSNQVSAKADLMATLGDIYRRLGLHEEAENLLLSAQELQRTHPTAPGLPIILRNLGRLDFDRGDYAAGKARLQQVVAQSQARYGNDHLSVAEALFDLANGLQQSGDYDLAEATAAEAWQIQQRLGASMSDQLASRMLLANLLMARGKVQEAIALQEDILDANRRLFGDDHFKVAAAMNDLAAALVSVGRFDEAETHYLEALKIRQRILEPSHPEIVQSLSNLTSLETYRDQPIQAAAYVSQALALAKESMGEDHPNLSFLHLGLASARLKLNDPGAAEAHARRSYELRRDAFGPHHTLTLRARLLLGKVTLGLGCLAEAEEHLLTVRDHLDPRSQNWLRDHEVLATALMELYRAKGDLELASRYEDELRQASETRLAAWN